MIKLIVGLGNPGQQYFKTRHNAGFWFLDELIAGQGCSWSHESRFEGFLASIVIAGKKILLLEPQTFMNRSGQSVGKLSRYFKIDPEAMLVVHDELDFEPGVVRLKKGGGHAGHNGLRDITAHLGSNDFFRLRIGIGRPPSRQNVADYVLSEPSRQDREGILSGIVRANGFLEALVAGQYDQVMMQLHQD